MINFMRRSLIFLFFFLISISLKTYIQAEVDDISIGEEGISKTSDGIEYRYLTDGTIGIVNYDGNSKNLVIPDTINGVKVTEICEQSFANTEIVSVKIPDTVRTIASSAFENAGNLKEITIPDNVTELGESAFEHSGIVSAKIGNGIKTLPEGLFRSCDKLEAIVLPVKLQSIEAEAIYDCNKLFSILIPKSVSYIDETAFDGSNNVTITCYYNSEAHKFAEEYKFLFSFIGTYLKTTSATLYIGNSISVPIVNGKNNLVFSSSDKKVATVSKDGKITALSKGTVKITAKSKEQTFTFKVTVKDFVISKKSASVTQGKSIRLRVKGASKITWKSSNTSIATVNEKGKITGKKIGTTMITALINGKSLTCKVAVKENSKKFPYTKNYSYFQTVNLQFSKITNYNNYFLVEGYLINSSHMTLNKINKITINVYSNGKRIAKKQFKNISLNLKSSSSKKITFKIETKNNKYKYTDFRTDDIAVQYSDDKITLKYYY